MDVYATDSSCPSGQVSWDVEIPRGYASSVEFDGCHKVMSMARETVRTYVILPKELVEAIDRLVGQRRRSAFLAEAVAEKFGRERLGNALAATTGFMAADSHPEWETPETVSAWVRGQRADDRDPVQRSVGRST